MAVRPATAADLEGMTRILIASSDDDPCYPYRFPWRHQYPAQYEDHCRRKCWEYLTTNTVDVYEVAADSHGGEKTVVAFSVWDQPEGHRRRAQRSQTWPRWSMLPSSKPVKDDAGEARHQQRARDTPAAAAAAARPSHLTRTPSHPKPFARADRSQAFRDESKAAKTRFFDEHHHPGGYVFLKILLCHPDHRRRGAGTALVMRGVAVARIRGVVTALFSSPAGAHLYRKLGFREVGRFEVRVEGDDDEGLDIPAMVLPAPGAVRSRRGSRCLDEVAPAGLRKCSTHNIMVVQKV